MKVNTNDLLMNLKIHETLQDFHLKYLLQNAEIEVLRSILFGVVAADKSATNPNYLTEVKIRYWDDLGERVFSLLSDDRYHLSDNAQKEIDLQLEAIKKIIDNLEKDLIDS